MFGCLRLRFPEFAPGIAVAVATCGAVAYWCGVRPRAARALALRRAAQIAEYAALLALAPAACWVVGLYGALHRAGPQGFPW
jgi:hypothetical protein